MERAVSQTPESLRMAPDPVPLVISRLGNDKVNGHSNRVLWHQKRSQTKSYPESVGTR